MTEGLERRGRYEALTDWERDTGMPWPRYPLNQSYHGQHHYREGRLIVGQDGPWRLRDKLARVLGYHCWECFRI